jgi:ubiquitin carboxyl-terminal hydrolase 34
MSLTSIRSFGLKVTPEVMHPLASQLVIEHVKLVERMLLFDSLDFAQLPLLQPPARHPIFTYHLNALNLLFSNPETYFSQLLGPVFMQNVTAALLTGNSRLQKLVSMLELILDRLHQTTESANLPFVVKIMLAFVCHAVNAAYFCAAPTEQLQNSLPEVVSLLVNIFHLIDSKLHQDLNKQNDPLNCDFRRDFLLSIPNLLRQIMELDENMRHEFSNSIIGSTELLEPMDYSLVAGVAWKIKLLKQFICSGRMELRVLGTDWMATELVSFFNGHKGDSQDIRSTFILPIFQCIARILVAENIVDYIVSVSSHPQIVNRSYNIIGFLVVTNNFTQQKADLVWDTLLTSQDPRMVAALFGALSNVTRTLTNTDEELYLCKKVVEKPLPFFGADAAQFIQTLLGKFKDSPMQSSFDPDARRHVMQLCIGLLCQCSEPSSFTSSTRRVFEDAVATLNLLSPVTPADVRHDIYRDCTIGLQNTSTQAPLMLSIFTILKFHQDDVEFLTGDLDLLNITMEAFSQQVVEWKMAGQELHPTLLREGLERRLELVLYLFFNVPQPAQSAVTLRFWNHLVGRDAVNTEAREFAWQVLDLSISRLPQLKQQEIFDLLYKSYLPKLTAGDYVRSFIDFVEKITRYKLRKEAVIGKHDTADMLTLPGLELMWTVVLSAPNSSGPEKAMKFLTSLFLEKHQMQRFSNLPLDQIHVSLVHKCINTMDNAFMRHRKLRDNVERDSMDAADPVKVQNDTVAFCRVTNLLLMMLQFIRNHPDLSKPLPPVESSLPSKNEEPTVESTIIGDEIRIPYEVHKLKGETIGNQWLNMDDLATRKELHSRIASEYGLGKFKAIWGGAYISLLDDPLQTIRDFGAVSKGRLIVKEISSNTVPENLNTTLRSKSQFELELLQSFDTVYKFMDSYDAISKSTYRFLQSFEPHESICLLVLDQSSSPDAVFPPAQGFKQLYSLRCLNVVLEKKLSQDPSLDKSFLIHGIGLLERILSQSGMPEDPEERLPFLHTCKQAVPTLNKFLKTMGFSEASPFRFPEILVQRLLKILSLFQQSPDGTTTVREIYELLLVASFQFPDIWTAFSDSEILKDLHSRLFLLHPNPILRAAVVNTVKTNLQRFPSNSHVALIDCLQYYWEMLIPLMDQSIDQANHAEDFYVIINELFNLRFVVRKDCIQDNDIEALRQHYADWTLKLLNYEQCEFVGREITDKVLSGLSGLLGRCIGLLSDIGELQLEQLRSLAESLWHKYLFPPCTKDNEPEDEQLRIPLLDSQTRGHIYRLVSLAMLHRREDLTQELAMWMGNVSHGDDYYRWQVDRNRIIRPSSGFLGLRNLGNTCYMNSLMTQLYMNPGFRSFMMNDLSTTFNTSLLKSTQELFCHMQNSFEPCGDPALFARQIRTYTGEGINVTEQMDVEEFFNLLFEQWEDQLDTTALKQKFRSFYGGKLVYQIKSMECEHVSEREEPCLNIQCDVQGKSNLEESLKAYIEGDVMQGDNKYKCESCGGKLVNAVRRTCLKDIPDNLILHLKRFEYDISLQRRNKINDCFEFPMKIDMSPYTFDRLSDPESVQQEDKFELVGVLVHKGQAEHGHYISYIRTRPEIDGASPVWLLFDDSEVSEFDPRDIGDMCFGGYVDAKGGYATLPPTVKPYNAYMLFYQRSSSLRQISVELEMDAAQMPKPQIPPFIQERIHEENCQILRSYCLFGEPHQRFILEIAESLSTLSHDGAMHKNFACVIEALWLSIWRVSSKSKDLTEMAGVLDNFLAVMTSCDRCSILIFAFLARNIDAFRDLLTRTPEGRVRERMQQFVLNGLRTLRGRSIYGIELGMSDDNPGVAVNSVMSLLLPALQHMAHSELHFFVKGWDEFYGLLHEIANFGKEECRAMIDSNFVQLCLEQLVMHHPAIARSLFRFRQLSQNLDKKGQTFNNLAYLLLSLLKHTHIKRSNSNGDSTPEYRSDDQEPDSLPLTPKEWFYFDYSTKEGLIWINRMFERWEPLQETHGFAPAEILELLLKQEGANPLREDLFFTVSDGIAQYSADVSNLFIRAAPTCIRLCTDYSEIRRIFQGVTKAISSNDSHDGRIILDFWKEASQIQQVRFPPPAEGLGSFYKISITVARAYAPWLLTWPHDQTVRLETLEFLNTLIFSYPAMENAEASAPTDYEIYRTKAVRMLAKTCQDKAAELLETDTPTPKPILQPLIQCMAACLNFLEQVDQLGDNATAMKSLVEDQMTANALQGEFFV